jgi:hypothetical protein
VPIWMSLIFSDIFPSIFSFSLVTFVYKPHFIEASASNFPYAALRISFFICGYILCLRNPSRGTSSPYGVPSVKLVNDEDFILKCRGWFSSCYLHESILPATTQFIWNFSGRR